MSKQTTAKLRLKPCRLRRHKATGVGHIEQLVDRRGKHRKRHCETIAARIDAVHLALELAQATNSAHELDAPIGARVTNSQNRREHLLLKNRNVEAFNGVAALEFGLHAKAIPFAVEIHSHSAFIDWLELGLLLMDNLKRAVFASEGV